MVDDRLPVLMSRRGVLAVGLLALLVPGCIAPGPAPGPSSRAGPPTARSSPSTPTASVALHPSSAPSASVESTAPSPIVDPVFVDVPRGGYTILCESWGGEPPPDDVGCKPAIDLALAALTGEQRALTRRFDVRYGDPCVPGASCARNAGVRTIYAIAETLDSIVIRVARDAGGEIFVWPPAEGPRMAPRPFSPPATAALDLGPLAPREVRDRTPLPFCGRESQSDADDFDTNARRCFLAGVDGWSPVEMIVIEPTDTGPVTHVYRFEGRGGIRDYVRSVDGWAASIAAISPIDTRAVFVLSAPSEPLALHGP